MFTGLVNEFAKFASNHLFVLSRSVLRLTIFESEFEQSQMALAVVAIHLGWPFDDCIRAVPVKH